MNQGLPGLGQLADLYAIGRMLEKLFALSRRPPSRDMQAFIYGLLRPDPRKRISFSTFFHRVDKFTETEEHIFPEMSQ